MTARSFARPGILVRARGREWVVLPGSSDELLKLSPLGGLDEEITGVIPSIEEVVSASFPQPTMKDLGDFSSGRLLRDAARLSTRAAAGPFRSFGRIAVEPRPYQLVPLMMALKLNPVRMLIADDVGIGKTIEACLIARELLDRGEINTLAVLCPPHLAEQWQQELAEKFHIDAELVLSSTIRRLEKGLALGESVFTRYPFTVVSTDFIKQDARANDLVNHCPDCVIVDEAHGCTLAAGVGKGRQKRNQLVSAISQNENCHLILVTATPHSGNEAAFRSLISLIDRKFADIPLGLDNSDSQNVRRQLAKHLVQRRRNDIQNYLESDTQFPKRDDSEIPYKLDSEYYKILEDILHFAREYVTDQSSGTRQRRVRYWSALALLRCVSSSPAAAIATLRSRAAVEDADDIDEIGRRTVLDQEDDEDAIIVDFSPGSEVEEAADSTKKKLAKFIKRLEAIEPENDRKLQGAIEEIKKLLQAGFSPIVFCRFIDTSNYVAEQLRATLDDNVRIESVTGTLPPAEREARIQELAENGGDYVLVCTDCLSEGINLQENFDAVLHYDLAWNPTRHEQREGRVDRFGQPKSKVSVVTYWGSNNPIDGVILDVLIRKHKNIKSTLGVTVSVPDTSEQIIETLFEGVLFREKTGQPSTQLSLAFLEELGPEKDEMHAKWDAISQKEAKSRFAQSTLNADAVAEELENVRKAIGSAQDVEHFMHEALHRLRVPFEAQDRAKALKVQLSNETPRGIRQAIGRDDPFVGRFELPISSKEIYLERTSPIVEGLASWLIDQALDSSSREAEPAAARCGAIRSQAVQTRTTLLIARFRFHLKVAARDEDALLCEEILPLAFSGSPASEFRWLTTEQSQKLLEARPEGNLTLSAIEQHVERMLNEMPQIISSFELVANERAQAQLETHKRVRKAAKARAGGTQVEPVLPVDVVGAFVLLPQIPAVGSTP